MNFFFKSLNLLNQLIIINLCEKINKSIRYYGIFKYCSTDDFTAFFI